MMKKLCRKNEGPQNQEDLIPFGPPTVGSKENKKFPIVLVRVFILLFNVLRMRTMENT